MTTLLVELVEAPSQPLVELVETPKEAPTSPHSRWLSLSKPFATRVSTSSTDDDQRSWSQPWGETCPPGFDKLAQPKVTLRGPR
ncbi:MAG: hypothetical protein QM711_09495 [Micropruina sp.]|uniref:hypothetical protein n=1 Tax=Micropruina sp. TaxID=2737536 RepID=UPI0039E384C6